MPKLFDRVKVNIGTAGPGTVTFGAASSTAFLTPAQAGAVDGDTVRYVIVDGGDFEEGVGTILASVGQMSRDTVTRSKISGALGAAKINLSGTSVLAFTASAADIVNPANNLSELPDKAAARGNLIISAANTPASPTGSLVATNVQNALQELDTDNQAQDALIAALQTTRIRVVRKRIFLSSTTYVPSAGLVFALLKCQAGGAGGGGAFGASDGTFHGHGGSGGGYAEKLVSAATIGASQPITIGAAGNGGAATNGGNGGDTSVGTLCVAKGGIGGGASSSAVFGNTSIGQSGGTGDVIQPGLGGGPGFYNAATNALPPSGIGGSSRYGSGGAGVYAGIGTGNGLNGTGHGTGGSGAYTANTASAATGGNGTPGLVEIIEFCTE